MSLPVTTLPYASSAQGSAKSEKDASVKGEPICTDDAVIAQSLDLDLLEPYPEGGRGWLVVAGCCLISAAVVGFGLAWGVFQTYYQQHTLPEASSSVLGMLGGLSGFMMTILSIFVGKLGDQYGYWWFLVSGCVLWTLGMLCIAFCTQLWHFFLTQGVMQGIAWGLVFPFLVSLPSQWFLDKRSLTTGLVLASSSWGGAVSSALIRVLLSNFGLRKTMFIKTGMDAVTLVIGLALIKERKPPGRRLKSADGTPQQIVWFDRQYLKDGVFWSLAMCLFFSTLGYLTPAFFITQFTEQKLPELSSLLTVLPLTFMNIAGGTGRTLIGWCADYIGVLNSLLLAVLASGLSQYLIWNFVTTYAGIMAFSIIYGFFSGCFMSLASPAAARLYGAGRLAGLSGLLFLYVAPGQIAGATLSGAIYTASNDWHGVAAYAGGMQVLSVICLLYARFKREKRVFAAF